LLLFCSLVQAWPVEYFVQIAFMNPSNLLRAVFPILAVSLSGQQFDENLLKHFTWRSVGPAGAGGRVVDISVAGDSPERIYVATGGGGVWKSLSEGTAWEPIFEHETVGAIGAVATDPSNPDTVWVGTGEANPRNSVSWGDGVYKSTDGGKSWKNVGLKDLQHIGRICVDPRNPDVVYVAALGHVWGPKKAGRIARHATEFGGPQRRGARGHKRCASVRNQGIDDSENRDGRINRSIAQFFGQISGSAFRRSR